jgi:DNA-binding transcriptional ArsR family regulator
MEKTLMLLSMKDSKSVANAMSNETAQKIIEYLTKKKEATESEIAEKLKVPLPTIHYNIKQLKKAKLIEAKEFFWSKKGKEMLVYKLAKKYIIISPDTSESSLSKLKGLLPVTFLSLIGSGAIYLYQKSKAITLKAIGETTADNTLATVSSKGIEAPTSMAADSAQEAIPEVIATEPNFALWFLTGSLFVIIILYLTKLFRK